MFGCLLCPVWSLSEGHFPAGGFYTPGTQTSHAANAKEKKQKRKKAAGCLHNTAAPRKPLPQADVFRKRVP